MISAVDIFESDKDLTVLADLPGLTSDHVSIDLQEGTLTIAGEVVLRGSENETYLVREYQTGRFHRQFNLSDQIDQSKISAAIKDGVLRLVLPRAERTKSRKIEVKAV